MVTLDTNQRKLAQTCVNRFWLFGIRTLTCGLWLNWWYCRFRHKRSSTDQFVLQTYVLGTRINGLTMPLFPQSPKIGNSIFSPYIVISIAKQLQIVAIEHVHIQFSVSQARIG